MTTPNLLRCDGCGQLASPEHIAKRLQRLEWTTRYRPVHIGTLLLGGIAPTNDAEFLYAEGGAFGGEAATILEVAGVSASGKSADVVLAEFQRAGFLLTYVLDCPLEPSADEQATVQSVLNDRLPPVLARIRRSLKPKRLVPTSQALGTVLERLEEAELRCPIVLDGGKPYALDGASANEVGARLRNTLAGAAATGR